MPAYDPALWFMHLGCKGKHYLLGNAHTVKGRVLAWCPVENRSIFVSKADMGRISVKGEYWLQGFLHGNEPGPPLDEYEMPDYSSKAATQWRRRCTNFRRTGKLSKGG